MIVYTLACLRHHGFYWLARSTIFRGIEVCEQIVRQPLLRRLGQLIRKTLSLSIISRCERLNSVHKIYTA